MIESAALLVDHILPRQPIRQWVLSVPFALRFLFASKPAVMSNVLIQQYNAEIIGISKDKPAKHQQFKQQYALPFLLLSDESAGVCEAYGVIDKKSLFGKSFLGIQRTTFLIDENSIIRAVWPKVKVNGHVEEVLDELNKI